MKIKQMTYISIFSALMAICSWISIPSATAPFTLQTFAVFLALLLLGAKNGLISILVYISIGMVGLPVFANFRGGVSVLFSTTGGYIFGFIAQALVYMLFLKLFGDKLYIKILSLVLGLFVCYGFGTVWFVQIYSANNSAISFATALSWCVIPYIIPDLVKLALALTLSKRLEKHINI